MLALAFVGMLITSLVPYDAAAATIFVTSTQQKISSGNVRWFAVGPATIMG